MSIPDWYNFGDFILDIENPYFMYTLDLGVMYETENITILRSVITNTEVSAPTGVILFVLNIFLVIALYRIN